MNDPCNPRNSSVPLPGGGDTHIHPFGLGINDFTITTQIPVDGGIVRIHDKPLDPCNPMITNINFGR